MLLFFLGLVASAVAIRIAADRTLWAFVVPTTATVLLMGILLQGAAGAAMAGALAVLAGVMNRDALELAVYVLAGGLAALLTITRAERLNAFVRVALPCSAATNVARGRPPSACSASATSPAFAQLAGAGIVNAALSVILAIGSFAVLGNLFGIMTVFQLLELANPRTGCCAASCSRRRARTTTASWSATSPSARPRRSAPIRSSPASPPTTTTSAR